MLQDMLNDIKKLLEVLPKETKVNSSARFVCEYKGATFHIQIQSDDRFYFKSDTKKSRSRTWQFHSTYQGLLKHIKAVLKEIDEKDSEVQKDRESNGEYAVSLSALLTKIADTSARNGGCTEFAIGATKILLTENNRFIISHTSPNRRVKTAPIKPATAVDRLVNLEPLKFDLTEISGMTNDRKLIKAIARSLRRRKERLEAAAVTEHLLTALARKAQPHPRGRRWFIGEGRSLGDEAVVIHDGNGKFLLNGEWILPFQMLDKLGKIAPKIAHKLADPDIMKGIKCH